MNVCMIPVRMGSERLAKKNYLKIDGVTVLELAIRKARVAGIFDRIVVNTDDPELSAVAENHAVDFYLRPEHLGTSRATSDQLVADFFQYSGATKVFWLNTVSPLQTIEDIVSFFEASKADSWTSAVCASDTFVHSFYGSEPINFEWGDGFARTQDLIPIQQLNYAMMGWDKCMLDQLEGGQLFDVNTLVLRSSRWSCFLLKTEEDLRIIEALKPIAPDQGV